MAVLTGRRRLDRTALAAIALCISTTTPAQDPDEDSGPGQGTEDSAPAPAESDNVRTLYEREANERDIFTFDYGVPSSPSLNLR
jgi:hypothetical protein